MGSITRRSLLALTAGAAAGTAAGCAGGGEPKPHSAAPPEGPTDGTTSRPGGRLLGDGSTSDTGPQPFQPVPERLEPGQTPPQFVIFSWDGAGELDNGLFARFRRLAHEHDAKMTFFLSGLYCLPESKKDLYRPPNNPVGASAIGYFKDEHIKMTLEQVRGAWLEGHEIGTHFNGHFCEGSGSVGNWSPADWKSEIGQAIDFVTRWRTNTGFSDVEPLPFDYGKELIGGRTPCLLGQNQWLPTASALGFRYDASSPGGNQVWPSKKMGVWDLPLQLIPFPGHTFEVLSMDYNMLANQSHTATSSDPRNYPYWREQATASYIAGFERAYQTNRAPFYIGNHFEEWNGGIYMDAVEKTLEHIASLGASDVRMVSFQQFVDWLDAQDPALLARLRTLDVGSKPSQGWRAFTGAV
ncbi:polysaccharide deacetylase family protein [Actinacidiphila bryophytorum]|uniref:Lipoprotein n=1 Tax=Actinacidiphila bryophytorum TaxID=1436133 RepID=A0A9W4E405_9ACTN|nr:hypothetical protein [Actinacidiphila bryophytorum]MBM9435320.1 hypothetical protein [Actinacidiphila bryophytorum]MBN6542192.1 hypothetical protein [Actinacidiphila bryophytorum]CAG7606794.1 conserved exported hypothetical protein [Actinacidiphila bryophytorum]